VLVAGCGGGDAPTATVGSVAVLNGKVIAVQKGTTSAGLAKRKSVEARAVRVYPRIGDAYNALQAGRVDAVLNDFPLAKYVEQSSDGLRVTTTIPTGVGYGLAMRAHSPLVRVVNGALARIKKDGTYAGIYRKWIGQEPLPGALRATTPPLPGGAPPRGLKLHGPGRTLLVGSDIPYPPFEFGEPPAYEGFDVDIVNAVARSLGLAVRWMDVPYDRVSHRLAAGKLDLVASGLVIPLRTSRKIRFSEPYLPADQSVTIKD
jgi:ABC-type amino acid transport substrate-binding protein